MFCTTFTPAFFTLKNILNWSLQIKMEICLQQSTLLVSCFTEKESIRVPARSNSYSLINHRIIKGRIRTFGPPCPCQLIYSKVYPDLVQSLGHVSAYLCALFWIQSYSLLPSSSAKVFPKIFVQFPFKYCNTICFAVHFWMSIPD